MAEAVNLTAAAALKAKWLLGEPSYGAWHAIGHPMVSEILAGCGYDWLLIDMEHTAIDLGELQTMLMAIAGSGTVPIVRVPDGDPALIKRVLDIGAAGILVPNVTSAAEAARIVAATKYPPVGTRGWGPWRASSYFAETATYRAGANAGVIAAIQIESASVLPQLDAILATPGLDAVFSGPADLAFSMGHGSSPEHPAVSKALARLFAAARKVGMPMGHGSVVGPQEGQALIAAGVTILPVAADVGLLAAGRQAVQAMTDPARMGAADRVAASGKGY